MASKSSILEWVEFAVSTPNTQQTLGFNRPGDSLYLGNRRYLVGGLSVGSQGSGAGVLAIVALADNPKRIIIETSVTYPQIDPYSMYFNPSENRLYVYDVAGQRVVFMPFALPGILPTGNPWIPVAGSVDIVAFLYDQYQIHLSPSDGTTGLVVVDSRPRPSDGLVTAWQLDFTSPMTVVTPLTLPAALPKWSILGYSSSAGPLQVSGYIGPFSIQEKTSQTSILYGANSTPGFEPLPIPPGLVIPGGAYRVMSSDEGVVQSSNWFTLYSRWGDPTSTSVAPKTIAMNYVLHAHDLFVGSTAHAVIGGMDWADPAESSSTVLTDCYLWIGVNDGPGAVFELGNTAFIANPAGAVGPFSVVIQGELSGPISAGLPIPNDEALAGVGVEVLYQFSAGIGSEIIVSDVIGAEIQSAPVSPAAAAQSTTSTSARLTVLQRKSRVARAREWLRAGPSTRMSPRKQAIRLRLEQLMQR